MANEAPLPAIERIDRALVRIEAAGRRSTASRRAIETRHAALKTRIGDAIGALDALIAETDD